MGLWGLWTKEVTASRAAANAPAWLQYGLPGPMIKLLILAKH